MTIALTAFTARGLALAQRLADGLNAQDDTAAVTPCFGPEHPSLADFTANAFAQADALVFVGAAGIAVRAIAPHLSSKTRDPAVVVLDETGAFAVSPPTRVENSLSVCPPSSHTAHGHGISPRT